MSYAIDLGTEVSVKNGNNTSRITKVKAVKGIVSTETLIREEKVYDISNRSTTDRVVLLEHPNRKGQGFKSSRATTSRPRKPPMCSASRCRSLPRRT